MPLKELVDGAHHNIEGFHLKGVMPAVRKHDLLDGDTANSVKEGSREVQWCPGICCWLSKQERTDRKILRLRSPTTRPLWHHQCPRRDGRVLGSAVVTHGRFARVAQWIERLPPEQEVVGSNPISGTLLDVLEPETSRGVSGEVIVARGSASSRFTGSLSPPTGLKACHGTEGQLASDFEEFEREDAHTKLHHWADTP